MSIHLGIEIGHTPASGGASHAPTHLTEYDYNQTVARAIQAAVAEPTTVFSRDWEDPRGLNLPEKINGMDLDVVVSLHANAFKGDATGCETLYWPTSDRGGFLAETLVENFNWALGNHNRGATARREGRGARFLRETEPVYVLCEPFFIDEEQDLRRAQRRLPELIEAYAEGVRSYREHYG